MGLQKIKTDSLTRLFRRLQYNDDSITVNSNHFETVAHLVMQERVVRLAGRQIGRMAAWDNREMQSDNAERQ